MGGVVGPFEIPSLAQSRQGQRADWLSHADDLDELRIVDMARGLLCGKHETALCEAGRGDVQSVHYLDSMLQSLFLSDFEDAVQVAPARRMVKVI